MKKKKEIALGGLIRRALAYGLDWYFAGVLANITSVLILSIYTQKTGVVIDFSILPTGLRIFANLCIIIALLFYYIVVPVYIFKGEHLGKTIMKRAFGLKIIKKNGRDVDLKTMLMREIIGVVFLEGALHQGTTAIQDILVALTHMDMSIWMYTTIALTLVSVIVAICTKSRQMFHDRIADTLVIDTRLK